MGEVWGLPVPIRHTRAGDFPKPLEVLVVWSRRPESVEGDKEFLDSPFEEFLVWGRTHHDLSHQKGMNSSFRVNGDGEVGNKK
jgi:hypothetical protein